MKCCKLRRLDQDLFAYAEIVDRVVHRSISGNLRQTSARDVDGATASVQEHGVWHR